jgi:propanol-preferring alcohol dehydrogenase
LKAWRVERPGPAETAPLVRREPADPAPGPGDVLLRVLACGVCHTDVHVAEGDLPLPRGPVIPGHQIVGEVVARGTPGGPGAAGTGGPAGGFPAIGERVGVTWLAGACGACPDCRGGRENLCPDATFTGWHVDGGFAELAVARADVCVPLPPDLPDLEAAPLLCAGVIGWRALKLSGVAPGQRLGLVGFGASAHLVLQIALRRGVEVVVFSRGEAHRELARQMGAAWAGALEDERASGTAAGGSRTGASASNDPAACDGIISFAPVGSVVPAALRRLRPGGTLAINAVHLGDIPSFPYESLFGERILRSVSNVTRRDARELMAMAADGYPRARITPYAFERANEALVDVKSAQLDGQAVLRVAA